MMMNGGDDDDDANVKPLPTFYGNTMPTKISLFDGDEDDNEYESPTRKMYFKPFLPSPSLALGFAQPANLFDTPRPSKKSLATTSTTISLKLPPRSNNYAHQPHAQVMWNIENVPVVPKFHPLERTSVLIPDAPPSVIAERLVAILQQRSIQAQFHHFKATCCTPEEVDFRIFVYHANSAKKGIIVEIQRRFGNSMNYHHHVRALLDAAQGKVVAIVEDDEDVGPPPLINDGDRHHIMSLEFVSKMLDLPATTTIGFQTLMSLTDGSKMGATTANQVAGLLWESKVGYKVVQLLVTEKQYRSMALRVLGNALSCGNKASSPPPPLKLIIDTLLPILIKIIHRAPSDAQAAHLATKCLEPLVLLLLQSGSHDAVSLDEISKALGEAVTVGHAKHAALASQAEHCLQRIELSH